MSKKQLDKMTKSQQRVAIAKNLLKLIHAGRIKATVGIYLQHTHKEGRPKPNEACRACELGALFVSQYQLFDGNWLDLFDSPHDALSRYFTKKQLRDIEDVFEGYIDDQRWGDFDNHEDRMIAMTQNIVDHNGTFKLNVEYEMV